MSYREAVTNDSGELLGYDYHYEDEPYDYEDDGYGPEDYDEEEFAPAPGTVPHPPSWPIDREYAREYEAWQSSNHLGDLGCPTPNGR